MNLFTRLRKWRFKRALARKFEHMAWELEANAQFEDSIIPDLRKFIESVENEIAGSLKKADALSSGHTKEDREEKKNIEERVSTLRQNAKRFNLRIQSIKSAVQTNRQQAGDIAQRRIFIQKHF